MTKQLQNYFRNISIVQVIAILAFYSCSGPDKKVATHPQHETVQSSPLPDFNSDSAYSYIKQQVDFGPRVPNTTAHVSCGNYLYGKMSAWCDTVIVQSGVLKAYDGTPLNFRNIISVFNPEASRRILLFAHWDTRPWSDQDTENKTSPALGADDGASGVAVLMEVARICHERRPSVGVDLIFFDAEDWGKEGGGPGSEDSYALGTQYWTKNLHVKNYTAEFGILLDMVGGKNAQFRKEGLSRDKAGFVVDEVWNKAVRLGYSSYFLFDNGGWVTDDHVYVNEINIPSIDIIHSDLGTRSGFPKWWHTHSDNMEVIDRATLKAVGQTLLGVVYWRNGV